MEQCENFRFVIDTIRRAVEDFREVADPENGWILSSIAIGHACMTFRLVEYNGRIRNVTKSWICELNINRRTRDDR